MDFKVGDLVKLEGMFGEVILLVIDVRNKVIDGAVEVLDTDGEKRWISSIFITKINDD